MPSMARLIIRAGCSWPCPRNARRGRTRSCLPKAHPGEHPAQVPVRLSHVPHDVHDPPVHEAEVSGVHRELEVREAMHGPVERVVCQSFMRLSPARLRRTAYTTS